MISHHIYRDYIQATSGFWIAEAHEQALLSIKYAEEKPQWTAESNEITAKTCHLLREYFAGKQVQFDIPLDTESYSDYYRSVWNEVSDIPYGKMKSYSDIALAINNPDSVRAVGMANGKNPFPIIIPCHRVVGKDRSLTGYAYGVDLKKKLLILEGALAEQTTLF